MSFAVRPVQARRRSGFVRAVIGVGIAVLAAGIFLAAPRLGGVAGAVRDFFLPVEATDGVTNILLLGNAGGDHDGATLTDTIIVASLHHREKTATLLSIPRDLLVNIRGVGPVRVNQAWQLGRARGEGPGQADFAKKVIGEVTGQPIHYFARIDFASFEKAIDLLGGVEIFVENSFTDYEYPGPNWSYKTVIFRRGPQILDGQTALEFARSRHGDNGEGSDFARTRRQQMILNAIRDKALSGDWLDPTKIREMFAAGRELVDTDLGLSEILGLAGMAPSFPPDAVRTFTLTDAWNGFLYTPDDATRAAVYAGAFVLLPIGDDFEKIHKFAEFIFHRPGVAREGARIEVLNASGIAGLAHECRYLLDRFGFDAVKSANSSLNERGEKLDRTAIFDHTPGNFPETLAAIPGFVGGEISPTPVETGASEADLTVTLGRDAADFCGEN